MIAALATWTTAHQGGWDEILLVLVPLLVMAGVLAMANRRAKRFQSAQSEAVNPSDDPAPPE